MMKLFAEKVIKKFQRAGSQDRYFTAVEETSLLLEAGRLVEINGRSGSGKSTLLSMMGGLLQPDAGKVFLEDIDLYKLEDGELSRLRNRQIGMIPQGHTALRSLSVLENVLLPSRLYEPDKDASGRARQLLEQVGIGNLTDANPEELSGGELRRMSIARALIQSPQVVLADEPTGDLDDENTELVLQLLRDIADTGAAVLLVTHESAADKYADRIYTMTAGRLETGKQSPVKIDSLQDSEQLP